MDEQRNPEGPSSSFEREYTRHDAQARQRQAGYPVDREVLKNPTPDMVKAFQAGPSHRLGGGAYAGNGASVAVRGDSIGQANLIHQALTGEQEALAVLMQGLDILRDKLEVAGLLRRELRSFMRSDENPQTQAAPPTPPEAPPQSKLGEELYNARTRVNRQTRLIARAIQDVAELADALDV